MNNSTTVTSILQDPAVIRRRHWRMIKDKIVRHSMTVGGISVIIAVVLIFFYLFYVVLPLFVPASIKQIQQFSMPAPAAGPSLYLAIEEKNEIAARFTDKGHIVFFR
ncbi:MAG: phosphate ABC transporter permease, partial [Pseudomonadota bacterium]|nr:phosphate ABC transporter permease [Pseudomonadota bacterium]